MTLHLGDFTKSVALLRRGDLILGLLQKGALVLRNPQVIHGDRNRGLSRVSEAQVLEVVGQC